MRILLDTCTFLWLVSEPEALSLPAVEAIESHENEVFLSSVSAWEIGLKHGLGKLPLPQPPELYVPRWRAHHLVEPLPLHEPAVLHLHRLPRLHNDPFDRMLVCQAIEHEMTILTPDASIRQYPVRSAW